VHAQYIRVLLECTIYGSRAVVCIGRFLYTIHNASMVFLHPRIHSAMVLATKFLLCSPPATSHAPAFRAARRLVILLVVAIGIAAIASSHPVPKREQRIIAISGFVQFVHWVDNVFPARDVFTVRSGLVNTLLLIRYGGSSSLRRVLPAQQ
jgi:hypothetical protein